MKTGPKPRPIAERFARFVAMCPMSGCWLWTGYCAKNGYAKLGTSYAHHISFKIYVGEIPTDLQVLHRCDVRSCVNPAHLFLGTQLDNMHDMDRKGRRVSTPHLGVKHWNSRLTAEQVQYIRTSKEPRMGLAAQFGVQPSAISKIRCGRTWKPQPTEGN